MSVFFLVRITVGTTITTVSGPYNTQAAAVAARTAWIASNPAPITGGPAPTPPYILEVTQ